MSDFALAGLFKTGDRKRDNFLSRVFGMFSEEPVRIWCRSGRSTYIDLGRPTIKHPGETRGATVDFALKARDDGSVYVAELKCELAYLNYGYLTLETADQVRRHVKEGKEAFRRFLDCARTPGAYDVSVKGRTTKAAGAILVWGSVTEGGRRAAMDEFGFAAVLAVEDVILELLRSGNEDYRAFLRERMSWCDELFRGLLGEGPG